MLFEVKKKSLCSEMIGIRRVIQITYIDCGEKDLKALNRYPKKSYYWYKDHIRNCIYIQGN